MIRVAKASLCLALLALAPASGRAEPKPGPSDAKLPPLEVKVDRSKVDLKAHRLEVKMSREAASVKIKVLDADGAEIAEEEHSFAGKAAGTPLVVSWRPKSQEPVARIEVYAYDAHGFWKGVAIVPWSVRIPHEEVLFDTDKAVIKTSERPKLEDSYAKIEAAIKAHKELGAIQLFIAGHTDSVGTAAYNQGLSRRRARAIGAWFKKRGLRIPIFFEGFGESVPAVKTADETPEPKNRRADYILAIEPPSLKSGAAAAWKRL